MIRKVRVPKLSANVDEVTLTAWLRKEGDTVRKGDDIVELTTDKAAFEIESPCSGILRKTLAPKKSVLPIGYVFALVGAKDDPLPDVEPANRKLMEEFRRAAGARARKSADAGTDKGRRAGSM